MKQVRELLQVITEKRKDYFDTLCQETKLNITDIEVLLFLHDFPEKNTLTQISKAKRYAKSYLSEVITHLINQGYIVRKVSLENKKIYKLYIQDKSYEIIEKYERLIQAFWQQACLDIDNQEIDTTLNTLKKITTNLEVGGYKNA